MFISETLYPEEKGNQQEGYNDIYLHYVVTYATLNLQFQVVGVADPRKFARTKLQQQHNILAENVVEGEH